MPIGNYIELADMAHMLYNLHRYLEYLQLVVISVLLAVAEGTPVAWLSVFKSSLDLIQAVLELIEEDDVMKNVLAMVGNGLSGVA